MNSTTYKPTMKQQFTINTRRLRSRKRLPPMDSRDALAMRNYMANYDYGDEDRQPPTCTPGDFIVTFKNQHGFTVQLRCWTLEDARYQRRIHPGSQIRRDDP